MSCTVVASPSRRGPRLPDHHHLHRRSGARRGADADAFRGPARRPAVRAPRSARRRHRRRRLQNAGGNSASSIARHGRPCRSASNTNTVTNAVNRDYAVPTYMALESSNGFSSASVGYAGTASDGLTMLDSAHTLTTSTAPRPTGTSRSPPRCRPVRHRSVTLALGFGTSRERRARRPPARRCRRTSAASGRLRAAVAALRRRPAHARRRWLGAAAVREYYESVNVVKASEDKTFPGAIAAGLASPWGQSVPAGNFTNGEPTYFGSYREEFSRDTYEAFTGLLVAGDIQTAQRRRPVPVRPPAAARRVDAAQLAAQRQGGARHRRPPARRDPRIRS